MLLIRLLGALANWVFTLNFFYKYNVIILPLKNLKIDWIFLLCNFTVKFVPKKIIENSPLYIILH